MVSSSTAILYSIIVLGVGNVLYTFRYVSEIQMSSRIRDENFLLKVGDLNPDAFYEEGDEKKARLRQRSVMLFRSTKLIPSLIKLTKEKETQC